VVKKIILFFSFRISLFFYFLIALPILFSGDLSLSNEESGTHLNFKNQKVEVMSLFCLERRLMLFYSQFSIVNFQLFCSQCPLRTLWYIQHLLGAVVIIFFISQKNKHNSDLKNKRKFAIINYERKKCRKN
jgi:hypothetical protein